MMQPERNFDSLRRDVNLVLQQLLTMIDQYPARKIRQSALAAMVRLTGSSVGFIYTIDSKAGTTHIENIVHGGQTSSPIPDVPSEKLTDPGIWNPCLSRGEPALRNQPGPVTPPLTDLIGALTCDLTAPIHNGRETVAVIGVGNSPSPYQLDDSKLLWELASGLGRVLVRKHLHDSMADDMK